MVIFNLRIMITTKLFINVFNTSLFWITLYCFIINNTMRDIIKYHFCPYLDYFFRKVSQQIYFPPTCIYFLCWFIMPNTNSKGLYHCTVEALPILNVRTFTATGQICSFVAILICA